MKLTILVSVIFVISIILYLIFITLFKVFYNRENKKVYNIFLNLAGISMTIMVECFIFLFIVLMYMLF